MVVAAGGVRHCGTDGARRKRDRRRRARARARSRAGSTFSGPARATRRWIGRDFPDRICRLCEVLATAGAPPGPPLTDAPDACVAACALCRGSGAAPTDSEARRGGGAGGAGAPSGLWPTPAAARRRTRRARPARAASLGKVPSRRPLALFGEEDPARSSRMLRQFKEDETWVVPGLLRIFRAARGWPYLNAVRRGRGCPGFGGCGRRAACASSVLTQRAGRPRCPDNHAAGPGTSGALKIKVARARRICGRTPRRASRGAVD